MLYYFFINLFLYIFMVSCRFKVYFLGTRFSFLIGASQTAGILRSQRALVWHVLFLILTLMEHCSLEFPDAQLESFWYVYRPPLWLFHFLFILKTVLWKYHLIVLCSIVINFFLIFLLFCIFYHHLVKFLFKCSGILETFGLVVMNRSIHAPFSEFLSHLGVL